MPRGVNGRLPSSLGGLVQVGWVVAVIVLKVRVVRVVPALEDVTVVVVISGPVLLLTPRVRVCTAGRRRRRCAGARHVCRVSHVVTGGASRASFFPGGRRVRFRARL